MRNVEAHLLEDKMDEAVTHYINSHQGSEPVHIDTNGIPMTVQDDGAGRVTVMHQQTYTTQMCRQVSVTEQVGDGPWGEELLEGPIAAIVAHLQNSRHHPPPHHKVAQVRTDVDHSVILDGSMRYNGQALDQQNEPIVVQLPPMQSLPTLQDMKRCADTDWFSDKNKKDEPALLRDPDGQALELGAASPAQHRQPSRKSLPHKKRISRKLKRNTGNCTPQQELVVINCSAAAPAEQEQILPDSYGAAPHAHHMSHEVRPMFICQICGDYYGEEQLKFYHHLKQHYEPHATIIIENPVPDLAMDKMTNNCIVDNVATLPDSIVELSLENTVPKTMYQPIDKHILYTSSDKTLTYNSNKLQYSMASMDKEPPVPTVEAEKSDLYETLDKLELYNCGKCSKTFRKQKQCEAHMRESHSSNTKLEDMGEFSEPEDLMAGIQVCVGDGEPYEQALLPHLTVENGHVHQEHTRQWYGRGGGGGCAGGFCGVCAREPDAPPLKILKEEVLQRIFDSEVSDNANFAVSMMPDHDVGDHDQDPDHDHGHSHDHEQSHSQDHTEHDNSEHGRRHNELDHRHNGHGHGDNEHNRRHIEHGSGYSEHDHKHSEHDHKHDERVHGLEDDHDHNEDGNEHSEPSHVHSDYGQSEHDHRHRLNDHGHEHNEHENSEHSQGHLLKQEVIRKDDTDLDEAKGKQFECPTCSRVFSHRNSLLYHVLSHAGKQHICRDCGKGFYTHGALKIHKRVHNGDRPYKCDVCGREFRQWSDLKYHKISLHSDKKHFKCEFCGKEFARKYSLNIHVRIHTGERNYKCDYCTKTFRASSYRLTHMRTHTGDRPYKCELCEKCFRSAFDLRRHMLVHDKMRLRLDEHKPKAKETQKKTKVIDIKEEQVETPPKKIKQVALASTTKPPVQRKVQKPKKSPKKGAPNVTVQNRDGHFKLNDEYTNNVEVYDNRAEYTKFKNVYSDSDKFKTVYSESDNPFKPQIVYKEDQTPHRDLAVLRPMFRSPNLENIETEKVPYRTENTDGKMHVFTHVEKGKEYNGSIVSNTQVLGDIRHLEREVAREVRSEISGEGIETGFLERLTAIYNIPAV